MADNPELSIIILNFNTRELLADCLNSIKKYEDEISLEVIVSDNNSSDGSIELVKRDFPWVKVIAGENVGFAKGNNRARPYIHGKMVLFLNPDTLIHKEVFAKTVEYLNSHKEIGALSCKLILPSGKLDKDARRRFPTPWISFLRLFLGNGRKYWYEDVDPNKIQEVDAIEGAFFLTRKDVLDKVGWFSEEYFLDGEDIDLCWKIKREGYKIIYYPEVEITHLKRGSKGNRRLEFKGSGVSSMEIFYRKWLWEKYPLILNYLVILGIRSIKLIRIIKNIFK